MRPCSSRALRRLGRLVAVLVASVLSVAAGVTAQPASAPVGSVSLDSDGNLVLNGKPFLLIQGTNMDYQGWGMGGYTTAQADAKLAQMVRWGFNTLFGNWNTIDPNNRTTPYQDALAWQRHGLYWHGAATLDDVYTPDGNMARYWTPAGQAVVTKIVNRHRTQPNLLLWWIANEWQGFPGAATTSYLAGAATVRAVDPVHLWGDTIVNNRAGWEAVLNPAGMPVGWYEATMSYEGVGETLGHLYDAMVAMNKGWLAGQRYVLGVSTTPIQEIDTAATRGLPRAPSQAEIHRFFMYQVANNARAFDVLWAVNQGLGRGDARLALLPAPNARPSYLDVWNSVGLEIERINSMAAVILAPGRWQVLATTPAFQLGQGPTGNSMAGVFAAKKTVAGVTYVIATNMNEYEKPNPTNPNAPGTWSDLPTPAATINVGVPVRSVTRLFETGAVSFSGNRISDSFPAMSAHVYAVR